MKKIKEDVQSVKEKLRHQRSYIDDIYDEYYGQMKWLKSRVETLESKLENEKSNIVQTHQNVILDKLDTIQGQLRRNNLLFFWDSWQTC